MDSSGIRSSTMFSQMKGCAFDVMVGLRYKMQKYGFDGELAEFAEGRANKKLLGTFAG
jgi:hypothetical protein